LVILDETYSHQDFSINSIYFEKHSIDIVFLRRRISKLAHIKFVGRQIEKSSLHSYAVHVNRKLLEHYFNAERQECLTNRTVVINFNSLHLSEDILSLNIIHC